MSEQKQILEQYLRAKFSDKIALSITRLDKLVDGWESDNYLLTVEHGGVQRTREDWVWRIYSSVGSQAKAARAETRVSLQPEERASFSRSIRRGRRTILDRGGGI